MPNPVFTTTTKHAVNKRPPGKQLSTPPRPRRCDGKLTLADIERETIVATLRRNSGHRQKSARALGIGVRTLGLKLKKWKEEQVVEADL